MTRNDLTAKNDATAKALLDSGRLAVDTKTGLVFARESKTPDKPIGTPNTRGYLRTCITTKGEAASLMVHRIVWISQNGVPPTGAQINHIDGVKTNNALANLELATPARNNEHARATGLWHPNKGLANGCARLSDQQVSAARAMQTEGRKTSEIAAHLGVSEGYTRRLLAGTARRSCRG